MFAWLSTLEPLPLIPIMWMIISKPAITFAKPSRPQNTNPNKKLKQQFTASNYRGMWQGLRNITDYKDRKHPATNTSTSLPDELNAFYARFEVSGSFHTQSTPAAETAEANPLSVSVADVTRSLRRVNIRKATGPGGIPGRVLKTCTHQLAGVFTDKRSHLLCITSITRLTAVRLPQ